MKAMDEKVNLVLSEMEGDFIQLTFNQDKFVLSVEDAIHMAKDVISYALAVAAKNGTLVQLTDKNEIKILNKETLN